jgi:ketosteroid isomerase-like protein
MSNATTKEIVIRMWRAMSEMDWEALKACMHPEIHYIDVPSDDPGAHGPPKLCEALANCLLTIWKNRSK